LSLEDWERTINIDLWSVVYGCKVFTPLLKQQGSGYIINTASSAGTLAGPEMAAYNVAKAGVVSLSETLKVELSKDNIGVTVICPTVFVTSLGETMTTGRTMENNLIRQLGKSKITPEHIVDDVMSAIQKNRLYVMTQADAKWGWRFKRLFPELYPRVIGYFYRNKKWLYSE
jgi:short-subunit dehydrogenase